MAKWRRPHFALFALLAMFSLVGPSFAWACPMTGNVGPLTRVCARPAQQKALNKSKSGATPDVMPCCAHQKAMRCLSSCCHPVPQFPGDDAKGGALHETHTGSAVLSARLSLDAESVVVLSLLPQADTEVLPAWHVDNSDDHSPLLRKSQNAPASLAGRAPPL